MTTASPSPPAPRREPWAWLGPVLLLLAAAVVYGGTFGAPFVYDDLAAIPGNASLRHLWPPGTVLTGAPAETTVGGRPVANLSLALNYAAGGTAVAGYHAVNLAIHVLAAWLLFGLGRRTLARTGRPALAAAAGPLALAGALLWVVHPLATEAVTYVVQRVESLAALWYLLTLYAFARSLGPPPAWRWRVLSVAACLLGMATKEVMVTAPLMVLLYDRTFGAGSFRAAWRERRGYYLALAGTWIPLAVLVLATGGNRAGSAGFNVGVSVPAYWLAQLEVFARYLGLSLWPRGQVFEYGSFPPGPLPVLLPGIGVTAAAVALTGWALWRRPALGFLGAWVFLILAPSSLVPVATQTMAEHRMYLPLAALCLGSVLAIARVLGRAGWFVVAALALALGTATVRRNQVYRSDLALWADTVRKRPDNANARNNYGLALFRSGDAAGAVREYEAALRLQPAYPGVLSNLGNAFRQQGQWDRAVAAYDAALRLEPHYAPAEFNLARALSDAGRQPEAIAHFRAALAGRPEDAPGHLALAVALERAQDPGAAAEYAAALRLDPGLTEARARLGALLCRQGQLEAGTQQLRAAVAEAPQVAEFHFDLANALMAAQQPAAAAGELTETLRLDPRMAPASLNLGILLCRSGQLEPGLARIEAALQLQPNYPEAHFARGMALLQAGRRPEAAAEFARVLALRPGERQAQRMLDLLQGGP